MINQDYQRCTRVLNNLNIIILSYILNHLWLFTHIQTLHFLISESRHDKFIEEKKDYYDCLTNEQKSEFLGVLQEKIARRTLNGRISNLSDY